MKVLPIILTIILLIALAAGLFAAYKYISSTINNSSFFQAISGLADGDFKITSSERVASGNNGSSTQTPSGQSNGSSFNDQDQSDDTLPEHSGGGGGSGHVGGR